MIQLLETVAAQPVATVASILLGYLVSLVLYRLFFSPLAAIPGPRLAAATDLWRFYYDIVDSGALSPRLVKLHQTFDSPIIRLGPNYVHVASPDFYRDIYQNNYPKDHKFYGNVGPPSIFTEVDSSRYKNARALIAPTFTTLSIESRLQAFETKVQAVCAVFAEFQRSGKPIDLRPLFSRMTFDLIGMVAFDHDFRFLDEFDKPAPTVEDISNFAELMLLFSRVDGLGSLLFLLPQGLVERMTPGLTFLQKRIDKLIDDAISAMLGQQASSSAKQKHGIFESLLEPHRANLNQKSSIPLDRISTEAVNLFGAGTDTVAITLSIAIHQLLLHPDCLSRLRVEMKTLEDQETGELNTKAVLKAPYLSAILRETLRIGTPLVTPLPRRVPAGGRIFGSFFIPANTLIASSLATVHADPDLFPDPSRFNPDRWLDDKLSGHVYAFSKGLRSCIGMNLATTQVQLTLAHLVHKFDLELLDPDPELKWRDTFVKKVLKPVRVQVVRKRSH